MRSFIFKPKTKSIMRQLRLLVIALLLSSVAFAQTRQLKGTVKDTKTGSPLPGVTVLVKGKNIAAVSGGDGSFTLNAPVGPFTLQVSLVGYGTKTTQITAEQSTLDVTMDESSTQLGELVVTALGITKDAGKVGYSVAKVDGSVMTQARETNVALSLGGRVAGLNVHGSSGGPGSSARILLRGMPSMNSAGSPLFVINGVPMDNSQRGAAGEWGGADAGDGIGNINPDDIESMTVLKGQAASALYGARAANGVIQITTKTGKKGAYTVEYNMNYSIDKALDFTDYQYVYGQGVNGTKPNNATDARGSARFAFGGKMDGSQFTQFDGKQYAYSPYRDNIANFYRTGPTFTNTVAVSGGTEKGTFRLSASNLDNQSIVRNSGLIRKTLNLNADQKFGDKFSVKVLVNYVDEQQQNKPQLSDGPQNVNNGLFLAPNINEDILKPGYDPLTGREIVFSDDNYVTNPWFVVNKYVNNISRKRLVTAVTGRYELTSWLYTQGRIGYDLSNDRTLKVEPSGSDYTFGSAFPGKSGGINQQTSQTYQLNGDLFLGTNLKLNEDFHLDAIVGANILKNGFDKVTVSGGPFIIDGFNAIKNVYSFGRDYEYNKRESHSGYYTVDLSYKNFLTVNTTGRYDAFSTLAGVGIPKSQVGIFTPSVSASFVFSELTHIPKMSYGKLRASYAQTSGEPGIAYQTSIYYSLEGTVNGYPLGKFNNSLPSGLLKPFRVKEIEVGTELKFFDNRLGFDISYFDRKTRNEIINSSFSLATGYSTGYVPTGATQNRGLEVMVTGTPVQTKDFGWNVSFNLTSVTNKILETDVKGLTLTQGTYRASPGNGTTAFVKGLPGPQIQAYDYAYTAKGEMIIDSSGIPVRGKLKNMGSVLPTLYGGLTNDFSYKAFNLSFLIDYNYGNKILSATQAYTILRGLDKSTLVGRENNGTDGIIKGVFPDGSANTTAAAPRDYYKAVATNITSSSVQNGDYIKLRQVTLGYTVPEKVFASMPLIRSAQISLVGRNLWTIMKKTDNIDPEAGFSTLVKYAGIEGTGVPSTRTYGVNVNIKFK
jgi:TonB-linked SusC/RagA family outer membrane protein